MSCFERMQGEKDDNEMASEGCMHGGQKGDINIYVTEDKVPIK